MDGLSGGSVGLCLFQGFSCPETSREASLNWRRILVLQATARVILAGASRGSVVYDSARSGKQASDEISSVCSQTLLGSSRSVESCSVDSGGACRPRMVAQLRAFGARRLPRSSVPTARLVVRRIGRGLGSSVRRRPCFRPMGSSRLGDVYKHQRTLGHRKSCEILCFASSEFLCCSVHGQLHRNSLSLESRGHSVSAAECHRTVNFALGGVSSGDLSSPICHGSPQRPCGFPVLPQPSLGLRVDPQDRGISGAEEEVTCDHRPVCHLSIANVQYIFLRSAIRMPWRQMLCLQNWNGWQAYAFPPWSLIPAVLKKLWSSSGILLTIVTPYWLQRPWFPDLLNLVVDVPVTLPLSRNLLRQPHFHRHHQGMSGLALHAWRLSTDSLRPGASPSM